MTPTGRGHIYSRRAGATYTIAWLQVHHTVLVCTSTKQSSQTITSKVTKFHLATEKVVSNGNRSDSINETIEHHHHDLNAICGYTLDTSCVPRANHSECALQTQPPFHNMGVSCVFILNTYSDPDLACEETHTRMTKSKIRIALVTSIGLRSINTSSIQICQKQQGT